MPYRAREGNLLEQDCRSGRPFHVLGHLGGYVAAESARATDTGQVHTDPPRVMHQLPAPPGAPFRALPDGPARPSVTVTQRNFTIRSHNSTTCAPSNQIEFGRPNCVGGCVRFTRTTQGGRERVFDCRPESPAEGFGRQRPRIRVWPSGRLRGGRVRAGDCYMPASHRSGQGHTPSGDLSTAPARRPPAGGARRAR